MTRSASSGALAAAAIVCSVAASASAATSLRTNASTRQAEVGEGIRVELSALTSGDDSPGNPRLRVPAGFSVQGPSVSTSQQISFNNGSFEHRHGITATWVVSGTRPGRFTLGPASVDVGQSVLQGETIEVEIVAAGSTPKPPQGGPGRRRGFFDPFDPFDPFSQFPKLPGIDDDDVPQLDLPDEPPPEFAVPSAPDSMAFLRATVEPPEAVVGQEIRLRIYGYGARGAWDETGTSEPSRADFLSQSIIENSFRQPRTVMTIDGARWTAAKVRDIALFPLHAGTLTVGPMTMGFRGRGYPETRPMSGLIRQSAPVEVRVVEPPIAGRPPGYELGDVGAYSMSAEVEPRRVDAGGAVAVVVRLEGSGNVPHHVKLPQVKGVEWADPTTTEAVTPTEQGVSGWRLFRYVVRLDDTGRVDLGEVTLPYYDPHRRRYEVARASLGVVDVAPGAAPAPSASAAPSRREPGDTFADLGIRRSLGARPAHVEPLSERGPFWAILLGAPISVLGLRGLTSVLGAFGRRARSRAASRSALARRALDEAREGAKAKNASAVAAAIERAIYAIVEERLGLRARAVLRQELRRELAQAGATDELAAEIVSVLDECETARFGGGAASGLDALVDRASAVVSKIGRAPSRSRKERAA